MDFLITSYIPYTSFIFFVALSIYQCDVLNKKLIIITNRI